MKKIFLFFCCILLVMSVLTLDVESGEFGMCNPKKKENTTGSKQIVEAVKIADVVDIKTLKLANGELVYLKEIKGKDIDNNVKDSIKKMIVGKYAILEYDDENEGQAAVYIIGLDVNKLPIKVSLSEPETKGFLNVKIGSSVRKGLAYNLNSILIKLGYAESELLKK